MLYQVQCISLYIVSGQKMCLFSFSGYTIGTCKLYIVLYSVVQTRVTTNTAVRATCTNLVSCE